MFTYRFYAYDVWGNEDDGWDVNDVWRTGWVHSFSVEPSEDELTDALDPDGFGLSFEWSELGWYVSRDDNGKPLGELRKEGE